MLRYSALLKDTKPYLTLQSDLAVGKLNHCYMIMGEDELAVDGLIDLSCEAILCKERGCGKCVVCQKIEDKNHEDIFEPKNLKADGIREFVEKVYVKSVGDIKIMIIRALDKVDPKVQNFLLKSLEEPIDGVVFLLGVIRQSAVLDTIKSRSKKLTLAPFTKKQLTDFFDDNYIGKPKSLVEEAVDCCLGSLARCESLLGDEEYFGDMSEVIFILKELTSTKVNLKMQKRLDLKDGKLARYLDIMQLICGVLLKRKSGVFVEGFERVNVLLDCFNIATLVNFNELIIEAKQKIESYCKDENILDNLFIKMMEVKYLCR
ncbi:MAG: hypothetical protein K2I23_02445 [Clostridia bacterium]|nr:hypothetical protein [Clostridia bacterium]